MHKFYLKQLELIRKYLITLTIEYDYLRKLQIVHILTPMTIDMVCEKIR